jgi:DNA-binding response OmpR family regulator
MAPRILVVDRNAAFATMLKEMLEADGGYEVSVAQRGSDALALLHDESFALTIIDMDLDPDDLDYRDLIPRVRESQPSMRLMLIPLMGESLSSEMHQLDIQGTLSKPFFADDLLPGIEQVLSKEVSMAVPPSAPGPSPEPQVSADVETILMQLAREIYADTVLLLSAREGDEHLIAHASTLDEAGLVMLANLSIATVRAAQATAHSLGEPDRPFEHNMFETDSLRLYVMSVPEELLLVVVTPTSIPLGTVRHNLRRSVRELALLGSAD